MESMPATAPTLPPKPPADAATVLLLRLGAQGSLEIFLCRRSTKSTFMGGVYVFPGGRVDAADAGPALRVATRGRDADACAAMLGLSADRAVAHWIAAIRETLEEAGVWLGDPATVATAAMCLELTATKDDGAAFASMVTRYGLRFDLSRLRYFAHWVTPTVEPKRFSARFFIAELPADEAAVIDGQEIIDGKWLTPADAIARYQAREFDLAPPTFHSLMVLAAATDIPAALALAADAPVVLHTPEAVFEGGRLSLVLAGDVAHPSTPGGELRRFTLIDGCWNYEGAL